MVFLELPDLSVGAPLEIDVARVPQVVLRNPVEAAAPVKARGKLQRQGLVVEEAIVTSRANGLLVELHGVGIPCLDARNLGGHQKRAVLEVLGGMQCPALELPMMGDDCL